MLAVIAVPIVIVTGCLVAVALIIIVPMMKKSSKVDKIASGLFDAPSKESTDGLLNTIASTKDKLVDKTKENARAIKDALADQNKINKAK